MSRLLLATMLAGCTFDVPGKQSARDQCIDYIDALDRKSAECADPPGKGADRAMNVAECAKVVAINPLKSVEHCIEELRQMACTDRPATGLWCSAFVEE